LSVHCLPADLYRRLSVFFRKFVFKKAHGGGLGCFWGERTVYTNWITKRLKETISLKNIKGISLESRNTKWKILTQ